MFLTIGLGNILVHHAIALALHTTLLILVKGALDAYHCKLMRDEKNFGYSYHLFVKLMKVGRLSSYLLW